MKDRDGIDFCKPEPPSRCQDYRRGWSTMGCRGDFTDHGEELLHAYIAHAVDMGVYAMLCEDLVRRLESDIRMLKVQLEAHKRGAT